MKGFHMRPCAKIRICVALTMVFALLLFATAAYAGGTQHPEFQNKKEIFKYYQSLQPSVGSDTAAQISSFNAAGAGQYPVVQVTNGNTNWIDWIEMDGGRIAWMGYGEQPFVKCLDLTSGKGYFIPLKYNEWGFSFANDAVITVAEECDYQPGQEPTWTSKLLAHKLDDAASTIVIKEVQDGWIQDYWADGDQVIWIEEKEVDGDYQDKLYIHNLTTGSTTLLYTSDEGIYDPRINGQTVAWEDESTGLIYTMDAAGSVARAVYDNGYSQYSPAIEGQKIAWLSREWDSVSLYVYDLAGDITTQEIPYNMDCGQIVMSGGKVFLVGYDYNSGEYVVLMCEPASGDYEQVYSTSDWVSPWAIAAMDNKVAWIQESYYDGWYEENVFLALLDDPANDSAVPSKPGPVSAEDVDGSEVELNWGGSTDDMLVAGYRVFRNGDEIGMTGLAPEFTDFDCEVGETYDYEVQAVDVAGKLSPLSDPVSVYVRPCPDLVLENANGDDSFVLKAVMKDAEGNPLQGKVLDFKLGLYHEGPYGMEWESLGTAVTDELGVATYTYSCPGLAKGSYPLGVKFAGDTQYCLARAGSDLFNYRFRLAVLPENIAVEPDQEFDAEIWALGVEDLYGADVILSFDTNTLEGLGERATISELFTTDNSLEVMNVIDNSNGTVRFAISLKRGQDGTNTGIDGDVKLATVRFRAKGYGTTNLSFALPQDPFSDSMARPIDPFFATGSEIKIISGTIRGKFVLEGLPEYSYMNDGIDVFLIDTATGKVVDVKCTDSEGSFEFPGVRSGDYKIFASKKVYLCYISEQITVGSGEEKDLGEVMLLTGDINCDNQIGFGDLLELINVYGKYNNGYYDWWGNYYPDPNWNPNADLNRNDRIDLFDLVLMARNYDLAGADKTTIVLPPPVADPAPGIYTGGVNLNITTPVNGAQIYFTSDGNDPSYYGLLYTGQIYVQYTQTVRAIVNKDGFIGEEATFSYVIN